MIENTVMHLLEVLGWALVRGECLLDRGWPLIKDNVLSFFTCHTISVSLFSINQKKWRKNTVLNSYSRYQSFTFFFGGGWEGVPVDTCLRLGAY